MSSRKRVKGLCREGCGSHPNVPSGDAIPYAATVSAAGGRRYRVRSSGGQAKRRLTPLPSAGWRQGRGGIACGKSNDAQPKAGESSRTEGYGSFAILPNLHVRECHPLLPRCVGGAGCRNKARGCARASAVENNEGAGCRSSEAVCHATTTMHLRAASGLTTRHAPPPSP